MDNDTNKKWQTVNRIANSIYFDCPKRRCHYPYLLVDNSPLPHTYHCQCGCLFVIHMIASKTEHTARILVEIKGDIT